MAAINSRWDCSSYSWAGGSGFYAVKVYQSSSNFGIKLPWTKYK